MPSDTSSTKKSQDVQHTGQSLLALINKHIADVPKSEFEKLPKDGASNHDYYLYGAAKTE